MFDCMQMEMDRSKKLAVTTVSGNNSTVVPDVVRTSEEIVPGDTLEWYLTGDNWVIVPGSPDGDE